MESAAWVGRGAQIIGQYPIVCVVIRSGTGVLDLKTIFMQR